MKAENRRVVITGMSVVAGNGRNRKEFKENCRKGVSGIRKCTLFPGDKLRTPYFGQVEGDLIYEGDSWKQKDRMETLMEMALGELYRDAGFTREDMAACRRRACLCLGTLLAPTGKIMAFARRESRDQDTSGWLAHTVDYGPWLREKCGVKGGMYIDSAACASGTTAAGMAYDFIRNGVYDVALVGGADPLTEVSAYGFHALQSLSTGVCRPFDQERDGINIGEGAAFFLFETLESARDRGARIRGEVLGYGLNNDAYHITSPDPEGAGAAASMKRALDNAGVAGEQVDYINAHGTGTPVNDIMEIKAVQKVFEGSRRPVLMNSTKALVGHCMGASGAVELAAVLLTMEEGRTAPMPGLENVLPVPEEIQISREGQEREIRYALSNSFAFAGNTASLLIGSPRAQEEEC